MEKKFKISKENYDLLSKMIALAKTRQPVQGAFNFDAYNRGALQTVEGIANCCTAGCLAGGYLPLIDEKRFYFDEDGRFYDGDYEFHNGKLAKGLRQKVFNALFHAGYQCDLGLNHLSYDATLEEVVENANKVLSMLEIKN